MRILLDESLPIELRLDITGHDVRDVTGMGWSGLKNGELLARAATSFDALVTADQNIEYQQNLRYTADCCHRSDCAQQSSRPTSAIMSAASSRAFLAPATRAGAHRRPKNHAG